MSIWALLKITVYKFNLPFPVLSFAKIIVHGKISKTNESYQKIINTKNMEKYNDRHLFQWYRKFKVLYS